MTADNPPRLLLFDLGGVLIDIDFERALRAWQPMSRLPLRQLRQRFSFDQPYRQHERGELEAGHYFDHLAALLELDGPRERIVDGWNAIFIRAIPQALALVGAARTELPCHAFTNTNAVHQQAWSSLFPEVVASFDSVFASHEMGCRKPERRAFEQIARSTGVPLASILFFDDTPENVEGARAAGLRAVHVRSTEDVRRGLQENGVLSA